MENILGEKVSVRVKNKNKKKTNYPSVYGIWLKATSPFPSLLVLAGWIPKLVWWQERNYTKLAAMEEGEG